MTYPPLDDQYLTWLYSQVGSVDVRNKAKTYWKLLNILYRKEFTWSRIERDGNRAQDGKDLRREFLRTTGAENNPEWMALGCNFLEMLVALAWKLEFQDSELRSQSTWFWILLENLGLAECNDAHPPKEIIVNHILDKVINRDYAPNGAGGLFPLENPDQDQRDVEIWYQAEAYLLERI